MPKPYQPNDKWSQKAAEEGYRARSVYKLMEIDTRFRLLRHGMTVLDCGAAPGSWLQYVAQKIGPKGKAIGIDTTDIEPIADNVHLYRLDMMNEAALEAMLAQENIHQFSVVLSDIAPNTTGIKDVDQWRSVELTEAVLVLAQKYLKPGGKCVMKVFRGADFDEFLRKVKRDWKNVKVMTPKATRDRSFEVYVICEKH
ncbi:MAG: cell division protein [Candidatus Peribacteria bacterium]|nr:cell division protein [Candidatus Peribacteria bacterium]